MKLTDADRKTIWAALDNDDWIRPGELATEADIIGRAFIAGKRAGREDMRERAERAVMNKWTAPTDTILDGDTIDVCAAAIRALGVDDER